MSLRLEMLQVARLAPNLLEEAGERVIAFLREQMSEDGGARDRGGASDLYYTVFLLESLMALRQDVPVDRVLPYLERFGDGDGLDLVHLTCLARCRAAMPRDRLRPETTSGLAERIAAHRSADGGYAAAAGAGTGTVYHAFLALGALQDLGMTAPDPDALRRSVESLALEDGSFANQQGVPAGTTPTTAGAVIVLHQLGATVSPAAADWLLARAHSDGGFLATENAPMPDLLSTATALHALAAMRAPVTHLKESTLDYLDTLWTGKTFCGNWADDIQDCEYTYYALLSLGHLSLA